MASPPGKKLQSLALLSGGEQALTALALLFAAFLTNPAPICVLDEVDAPLDDANVDRFCRLVGEIADTAGTRFLLVTHHRITMARVDRLFGVWRSAASRSWFPSISRDAARRLVQERESPREWSCVTQTQAVSIVVKVRTGEPSKHERMLSQKRSQRRLIRKPSGLKSGARTRRGSDRKGGPAMSGGSAAIPRAACAMSATSRLGSSGRYARHATPVSPW